MERLRGKKIAFIVDTNFEQTEYTGSRDILEAAGATTTLLSPHGPEVQGLNHIEKADTFPVDVALEAGDPDEYDAVVFPGGAVNADSLRMNKTAQSWLKKFNAAGKPVALICHAPWLAVSAEEVDERQWTSWPTLQDDIRNAGGEWSDEPVVVDGNFITSRKPDDVAAFSSAIIEKLTVLLPVM